MLYSVVNGGENEEEAMSVPSIAWPPLHRLPIVLLVVLAGCRSAPAPPIAPPPPEPPPIEVPPIPDVVEETRRIEEALETVEIELAPADAAVPAAAPAPAEPILPAAAEPADPPDPPALA